MKPWLKTILIVAGVSAVVGSAGFWLGQATQVAENITIPGNKSFYLYSETPNRHLTVSGSWEFVGPEEVSPKSASVHLECDELDGSCVVADASVYRNNLGLGVRTLSASWEKDRVVIGDGFVLPTACRTSVVVVDLLTEEVSEITKDAPNRPASCALPPLGEPRVARLVSGFDRYFDEKFPNRAK